MTDDKACPKCGMEWSLPATLWRHGPDLRPCTCGAEHSDGARNERTAHAQGRHNYRAYSKEQAARR